MFILKISVLTANLAHTIVGIEKAFNLEQYIDIEKALVFGFDCAVMQGIWYTVLFNKSVSSSVFIGSKRLPYHILATVTSIVVAVGDALIHDCESRIYVEFSKSDYDARNEKEIDEEMIHNVLRYCLILFGVFVVIWTRYRLYS